MITYKHDIGGLHPHQFVISNGDSKFERGEYKEIKGTNSDLVVYIGFQITRDFVKHEIIRVDLFKLISITGYRYAPFYDKLQECVTNNSMDPGFLLAWFFEIFLLEDQEGVFPRIFADLLKKIKAIGEEHGSKTKAKEAAKYLNIG
jgi:hypothetical protein